MARWRREAPRDVLAEIEKAIVQISVYCEQSKNGGNYGGIRNEEVLEEAMSAPID